MDVKFAIRQGFALCRILFLGLVLTAVLPVQAEEEPMIDPATLAGEHPCQGRNPDGSTYEGTVTIRVKNGLVLMEWHIGSNKSYGTGLVEGMGLGVGLESGLALYQIVPQAEGKSLIGVWATEGSKQATVEVIFIGDTDVTDADFPVEEINGLYRLHSKGGTETDVEIAGADMVRIVSLQNAPKKPWAQGLLLGSTFAMVTPTGLSVFEVQASKNSGVHLTGKAVDGKGEISPQSLTPFE